MATVQELADLVGGRVIGDSARQVVGVADLGSAQPHHISFLSNPRYREKFENTRAGAVLVPEGVTGDHTVLIVCRNPYLALAHVTAHLHPRPRWPGGVEEGAHVHAEARLDPAARVRMGAVVEANAVVGPRSVIGPLCYVGPCACIGKDVLLHPGAKVLEGCVLGDRVILQAGAVIGSDGFGYAPNDLSQRVKIPQVGIVEVGEDAEIGANCTVDRATFGVTRIGPGTKIDNLVQIAHNVVTGRDCVVVAQSGIAGSTTLGDRVIVGAQSGIVGHIEITDDVALAARSGVPNTIKKSGVYGGSPAIPHREWLRVIMAQQSVPKLRRRIRDLETHLAAMEERRSEKDQR